MDKELETVPDDTNSAIVLGEMQEILPYEIVTAAKKVSPHLLDLENSRLEKLAEIAFSDVKVKKQFWRSYNISKKSGLRMSITRATQGICKYAQFRKRFLNSQARLAWLLSPSTSYTTEVDSLLDVAMTRYEELIKMDITTTRKVIYKDEEGNRQEKFVTQVDAKKAMVLLSVIKNLEERAHGSAVQKQISIKTTEPAGDSATKVEVNMDAVNERLQELEDKLGPSSQPIIEV